VNEIVHRLTDTQTGRRIVKRFGDEYGLVYFGYVDQFQDEHEIVRGMTMSHKHHDTNYSVGSFNNYDVMYVQRADSHAPITKLSRRPHTWQIMSFDLHTRRELPHVLIGRQTHSDQFYADILTRYPHMKRLSMDSIAMHKADFLQHHHVYGRPVDTVTIEHIFTTSLDDLLTKHFAGLAIEISENVLYLYAERSKPTHSLLDAMIKNGTWLAGHIDTISKTIDD